MNEGILYGIGVGPGDPELLTLKAIRVLGQCRFVFAPSPVRGEGSVALAIARAHVHPSTTVQELEFPMVVHRETLAQHWNEAAQSVCKVLRQGHDACFLTLGDPLLYSTYIYLLRAVKRCLPNAKAVTIPGIMAFNAAAALTHFAIGEGKQPVRIVPTADDLTPVREALAAGGAIVLMKIGKRLPAILDLLQQNDLIDHAVLVARAGLDGQRIETNLRDLQSDDGKAGYLSVILVNAKPEPLP